MRSHNFAFSFSFSVPFFVPILNAVLSCLLRTAWEQLWFEHFPLSLKVKSTFDNEHGSWKGVDIERCSLLGLGLDVLTGLC